MAGTHRVLILGGGFGGLYAAKALKSADASVTLIDRRNFHLFQPLLYQVATGSLSPGEIASPLRSILAHQKNTRVLLGEAVDIDAVQKAVKLKDGARVEYDSLIVATGSQSNYFGHEEWRDFAPSLKSIEEATMIRHKILLAFEAAERTHDPVDRRAWLTFVIVGGGATGVELAGALGEIANRTLKHEFRSIRPQDARIIVVDGAPRVLTSYPEDLSRKATQSLLELCVQVRDEVKVTRVDATGVELETKDKQTEHIASRTVLWAAGVAVSEFSKKLVERTHAPTDKAGKIEVLPDLTVPNHPEIFVIGDLAAVKQTDGKPLPGVAQVAMQGGAYAAKAIRKRIAGDQSEVKPFHYFNKGDIAVIGRAHAVANVFGVHLSGLLAWLVWLFVHLMYIVQFQSRVLVFFQWGFQYLSFNGGARLITGSSAVDAIAASEPLKEVVEAN